jgi:hypothetical protein
MLDDFIISLVPQNSFLAFIFFIASVLLIILAVRTIPYHVVRKVSPKLGVTQIGMERALGVVSLFPEAVIIFVLVNAWFHFAALYTIIGLNIASVLSALILLIFVGRKNFIPHIYKPKLFLITIGLAIPFILLYEYEHIDPRTSFILILSYFTYILFSKVAMNEPAHPVEYSTKMKLTTQPTGVTITQTLFFTALSLTLLFIGTEIFIIASKILIAHYDIPKIYLAVIMGALLVAPKIVSFYRMIKEQKNMVELYTHEIFYNITSITVLNSVMIYTISFTFALITLS